MEELLIRKCLYRNCNIVLDGRPNKKFCSKTHRNMEHTYLNRLKYKNTEKYKDSLKKYRSTNQYKTYHSEYMKKYVEDYKDKRNKKAVIRRKNDILFNISSLIRSYINNSIKKSSFKKSNRTEVILGCSFDEFKTYLESKFEPWMTWENRGLYNGDLNYGWDIDHIIPLSSIKTYDDLVKLNHYTNLQPLCSYTNRYVKRDKINNNNNNNK